MFQMLVAVCHIPGIRPEGLEIVPQESAVSCAHADSV